MRLTNTFFSSCSCSFSSRGGRGGGGATSSRISLLVACCLIAFSPTPNIVVVSAIMVNQTNAAVNFSNPNDGFVLEGTLRFPAYETNNDTGDSAHSPPSVPGVVLIHGSGPVSRDADLVGQLNLVFGFTIQLFAEIGDALQAQGIAVLTYDKRTCGSFNRCTFENSYEPPTRPIGVDTFLEDAHAAALYLQGRPEIQSDMVSVIGHSQGGSFIPILLQRQRDLHRGVLLAGPFRPIDEIWVYQLTSTIDVLKSIGFTDAAIQTIPSITALKETAQGLAELRTLEDDTTTINFIGGVPASFWQSWFDITDQSHLAAGNISQPLLIVNGQLDWNVPVEEALAWDDYLTNVTNATNPITIVTPDCATHAMNCVNQSDITLITDSNLGRHVAPTVLDALMEFLVLEEENATESPTIEYPTSSPNITLPPTSTTDDGLGSSPSPSVMMTDAPTTMGLRTTTTPTMAPASSGTANNVDGSSSASAPTRIFMLPFQQKGTGGVVCSLSNLFVSIGMTLLLGVGMII